MPWTSIEEEMENATPDTLSHCIDNDCTVDSMPVPCLCAEESRCIGIRPHGQEPVGAAKTPTAVRRIPFQTAADVAGQERVRTVHTEDGALEQCEAPDATCGVGHDRAVHWRRQHTICGVAQQVGS